MLPTLIRRELLDNLMTFRFAAALFIMLLLVVANTAVLIKDYERRLADYNTAVKKHQQKLQERDIYSPGFAGVVLVRPPNPLSIFNVGLDKRLGSEIGIRPSGAPTLWEARMHGSANPLLNLLSSIALGFIFEVVLSLMALIFAYDALAGERERGTLRLVLTNAISRGHILLAKYISAMTCLLVPLIISLLFALILLTNSAAISLSADDFLRIGGIVLASIAYLSVFYLIGFLISAITHRTSTALMLAMFVWGFLVLVYPNMILATIKTSDVPQERAVSALNQMKQIWEQFDRERNRFLAADAFPGEDQLFNIKEPWGFGYDEYYENALTLFAEYDRQLNFQGIDEKYQPNVPHLQNYHRFLIPLTIRTADRVWLIRKEALVDTLVRQANFKRTLLKLSPVGIYDAATQAWTGTDLSGIRDFFDAARQYRKTVMTWFDDKDAFAAREWFLSDKREADWSTLPLFSFERRSVEINAKRALPDVLLLLLTSLVLFMGIFLLFVRSEV